MLCMSILEEAVNDADFVFEAVIEDMNIKQDLFERKNIFFRVYSGANNHAGHQTFDRYI